MNSNRSRRKEFYFWTKKCLCVKLFHAIFDNDKSRPTRSNQQKWTFALEKIQIETRNCQKYLNWKICRTNLLDFKICILHWQWFCQSFDGNQCLEIFIAHMWLAMAMLSQGTNITCLKLEIDGCQVCWEVSNIAKIIYFVGTKIMSNHSKQLD